MQMLQAAVRTAVVVLLLPQIALAEISAASHLTNSLESLWSPPQIISNGMTRGLFREDVQLTSDISGAVAMVWPIRSFDHGRSIWVSRYMRTTGWSRGIQVSKDYPGALHESSRLTAISLDGSGNATVAWIDNSVHVRIISADGALQTEQIVAKPASVTRSDPVLSTDKSGHILLAWIESDMTSEGNSSVVARSFSPKSGWGKMQMVSDSKPVDDLKLIKTGNSAILAVWSQPELFAAQFDEAQGWSRPQSIFSGVGGTFNVAKGKFNDVFIVWQYIAGHRIYLKVAHFTPTKTPQTTEITLIDMPYSGYFWPDVPAIAADGNGGVLIGRPNYEATSGPAMQVFHVQSDNSFRDMEIPPRNRPFSGSCVRMSSDTQGHAILVWTAYSIMASRYLKGSDTWSEAEEISDRNTGILLPASTEHGSFAVVWADSVSRDRNHSGGAWAFWAKNFLNSAPPPSPEARFP